MAKRSAGTRFSASLLSPPASRRRMEGRWDERARPEARTAPDGPADELLVFGCEREGKETYLLRL
jgi:hypothetical protein